ncbi:MAG: protein-(glutamine-N5) methyltransferase, release factor-specific [Robiginitomaculum sp.]|nr:MAG: protein-(glutamine-N5) methyltransferase, release factor-specific [Robiginitomaculum sp.]
MPDPTLEVLRRQAVQALKSANIEGADVDARILLMHASGHDRSGLIACARDVVSDQVCEVFEAFIARRLKHEPVAYILGTQEFWSLIFKVNRHVLIPRPETEGVVGRGLEKIWGVETPRILDVGTGSGAILISLLNEREDASGIGVDISESALDVAKENAINIGVGDRCSFKKSSFLENIDEKFDIIVSNPPYITDEAMLSLAENVSKFEPHLALHGGVDGLDPYREILSGAPSVLNDNAFLVFEVGFDQGGLVRNLMAQAGFQDVSIEKDYAGHDRIVSGQIK